MLPALLLAVVVALIPGAVPLPENGRIAFVTYQTTVAAGWVGSAPTGGPQTLLHAGEVVSGPVASPDGSRVAYSVGSARGTTTVYVARADGKGRTKIAAGHSPAWSPDGSRLVFTGRDGKLTIADSGGGTIRSLGVSEAGGATWSPNGQWIAFGSHPGIDVIRPDGTGRTKVADASDGRQVQWSSSGAWLAYTAVVSGSGQVHVVRPDGSARRSLGKGSEPVWAPGDNRLAFMNEEGLNVSTPKEGIVLTATGVAGEPAWSPKGTAVAVGSDLWPLRIVDARDGTVTRLEGRGTPSWSPDGSRLAYVQAGTLWTVAATGGSPRLVVRGVEIEWSGRPLWLGSGRLLYLRASSSRAVILSIEPNGRSPRLLASTRASSGDYIQLTWSPDGKRLAYVRDPEQSSRLEVVAAGGSAPRILARNARTPSWSPDAKSLVFSGLRGIHLIGAAGGRERQLTRGEGDSDPSWSPDARWIAFRREDGLYVIRVGGGGLRRLASGDVAAFSWSPDARRIAYDIENDAGTAIAVVGVDGKGRRYLAREEPPEENGSVVSNPRWSPDGRRILYGQEVYLCGSRCTEDFLVAVSPDGRSSSFVTETDEDYLYQAVWSPDGRRLLGQDGEGALFTLDLARKTMRKIASEPAGWASWQPLPRK